MNTGVRSVVTSSPWIPVSSAGLRRRSLTEAGVVLSIWKPTGGSLGSECPSASYWVYVAVAETWKFPLVTGAPVASP